MWKSGTREWNIRSRELSASVVRQHSPLLGEIDRDPGFLISTWDLFVAVGVPLADARYHADLHHAVGPKTATAAVPPATRLPRYMPGVLKGMAMFPCRSIAARPPLPPSSVICRIASLAASWRDRPLYSMSAETLWAKTERMKNSPWPVAERAHVAFLASVSYTHLRAHETVLDLV